MNKQSLKLHGTEELKKKTEVVRDFIVKTHPQMAGMPHKAVVAETGKTFFPLRYRFNFI